MPVLLKEPSEYQRHYTWHQSRKSRSYSPPLDNLKPAAGVPSQIAAKTSEPAITIKKKVNSAKPTNTTKFDIVPDEDEYMLLGNNDKFAPNVQYRSKSRDRAMNLLKKSKTQPAENGDAPTPLAPREPPPAPKVKYDSGAPKLKKTELQKNKTNPAMSNKATDMENVKTKSVLKQTQKSVQKPRDIEPVKSKAEPKFWPEPILKEKKYDNKTKDNKPPAIQSKNRRESRKGKMHEFAQTDLEKGVSYSEQEAPADYALKYKAGIAPPRAKGPKRMSEYAKQFQWKQGFPSSPMLAAEQIVYKSNSQAPPFHHNSMAKASEYNTQFKPWNMLKSTPNLKLTLEEESRSPSKKRKSRKLKRSRSLEDLSPDERPPAGGYSMVSPEDKRLLKESLNPQKLHFPHGKFKLLSAYTPEKQAPVVRAKKETVKYLLYEYGRLSKKVRSEYESNFAAPQKFDYEDGAWRGADPAHIVQRSEGYAAEEKQPVTWFREVVELRRKAEEYKKRALGTHFSRTHLAQLYAKQAEMWDNASNSGQSVVSALSLESRGSLRQARRNNKDAWAEESLDSPLMGTVTPDSERTLTAVPSVDQNDFSDDDIDYDDQASSYTASERSSRINYNAKKFGRIPTPKLQEKKTYAVKKRHHLDRTTPSVGGAILTSPPEVADTISEDSVPIVSKTKKGLKTRSIPAAQAVRESFSAPGILQPYQQNQYPTFGKPTPDSHVLIDEDTASDHTLRLDFIKTLPEVDRARKDLQTKLSTIKELSAEYKSTKASLIPNSTLTIDDIPPRPPTEDDNISISARSIASSCSLASEVLERAKNRQKGFWDD